MSRPSERTRAGRGSSVGGEPAQEALAALVEQFSERSAFVRELVQNSLDAGSGRIELTVEQEKRRLRVTVADDGEGMDRATIEGYLLTLFRSNKEEDLTKIGQFGIGFVSLFALKPELVVVDTSRDGVHHRVLFDEHFQYTLAQVDEPFEGTTVTLWVRTWGTKARELAHEVRTALHYWCRYARAEVLCEAIAPDWGWALEEVDHPFDVDSPVSLSVEEPGFRAVLGFAGERAPRVGYYNRGLTLLEANEEVLPGVTFRVEAATLEHTLTRDNVRRDAAFDAVISRLRALAEGPLLEKHLAALGGPDHADRLIELLWVDAAADREVLRTADGGMTSVPALRGGLVAGLRKREVLYAPGPSPLVDALVSRGETVVLGEPPELAWLRHYLPKRPRVDATRRFVAPERVDPTPLTKAAGAHAARFADRGALLEGQLCIRQERPGELEDVRDRSGAGALVVNVDHPLYLRCHALGTAAAPQLRTAMRRWLREP